MKKSFSLLLALIVVVSVIQAQDVSTNEQSKNDYKPRFGLKAGYNISYANGSNSGFTPGNNNGFMIAGFFGSTGKSVIGYRSEIVFSRQGYTYDDAGKNTYVTNDYIYLPQFTTINITKYLQLQAGMQIGYLLNSKTSNADKGSDSSLLSFMNRIDYGFAAGIEIYPFKGFILGARYNLGLGKMYKQYDVSTTDPPPFPLPFDPATIDLKSGSLQFFIGYRF
jgi:hypothetical protein